MYSMMAGATLSLIILSVLQIFVPGSTTVGLKVVSISQCGCFGETLTYECTVMGDPGGATVWMGTALNCPSDEIVLLHQRFTESGGIIRSCNNEATVAHSLYVKNNLFTSQLNVTVTRDLVGKVITCVYDDMSLSSDASRDINQFSKQIPGSLPPPNNFHISSANFISRVFMFTWSPVASDCPNVHYNILASNCGSCPTTTNHTTVTCTHVPTDGSACLLSVATVVCGNITGNQSEIIEVILNGNSEYNGAVASAVLFAIALIICVVIFTMIIIILLYREKLKVKVSSLLFMHKTTKESTYEDVDTQLPQASIASADLTKNIAYHQPQNLTASTCDTKQGSGL